MSGLAGQVDLSELPDDVRAEIQRPEVARRGQLQGLAAHVSTLRDEAVAARRESGIEATWLECEEAYLGIDDLTRAEFDGARWAKPMTMEGGLIRHSVKQDGTKATAFVMLTARYVDAGTSKVCEIALPVDGKPFTLTATPVPELAGAAEDDTPAEQITGRPMPKPDGQPATVADLAKNQIRLAEAKAEKACNRVYDWMVEYKHNAEIRKVIFDGARLGAGVLQGPIPEVRKARVIRRRVPAGVSQQTPGAQAAALTLEFVEKVKPAARWVDLWNFYPAPGCGEDIHAGGHAFVLDRMLASQLAGLSGPGWIKSAIKEVIEEGPGAQNTDTGNPSKAPHKKQFEVWHFTGKIAAEAFKAANAEQAEAVPEGIDEITAVVSIVNNRVIRAVRPVLESERLPFNVFNWRRRAGHWAGVGVAEQIKAPQKIANAATRAMLTNAGLSAGSQIIALLGALVPADGNQRLTPDKLWWLDPSNAAGIDDVRKAFAAVQLPNMTPQLMTIVEYGFKLAEEHSSIPLISQGQSGKTTPDTFGGQQLQDNNANQLLRSVGFSLNDTVTTPLVDSLYEWLLLDPDVPDDEKGDYQVDTSGALAVIEKALQDQTIMAMAPMVANQAFKIDPAKWFETWCRSKRMSPAEFQYSDADWEKISQQPQPENPTITAAKIRADAQIKTAESRDQLTSHKIDVDTDRDRQYNESLAARDQATVSMRMEELKLQRDLKMLDYALQERISLQEAKVRLADTTMKLQVQKELAGIDGKGPQVATPPNEPPGRAPDGEAYQA